jgi:prophage antirepressor-like protein
MESNLKLLDERKLLGKQFKVYGDFDNPLFLAKDVAEWIDYAKTGQGYYDISNMLKTIDSEEKLLRKIFVLGQNRNMWFLTEEGLYEILMQSTKPIAKSFKREVKKILKEIRINGGYIHTNIDDDESTIMAKALLIANKTIERHKEKIKNLQNENEKKQEIITEQKPKVDYYDKVTSSKKAISMSEVAKLLKFKNFNNRSIGRNILFEILRDNNILDRFNQPYQKFVNQNYFEIK